MSVIKVIKIGLPVATATSAAIATTSLVSFSKKDKIQSEEDLDQKLSDLEIPDEKYEDKELFYSKDGSGKNQEILDKSLAEKLSQLLKEKGDFSDAEGPAPDLSKVDLENIKKDAPSSHGQSQDHSDNKDQAETNLPSVKDDKQEGTTDQSRLSDDDVSESPEDGGISLQIPASPITKDIESKSGLEVDDEKTLTLDGEKIESHEGDKGTEESDEISTESSLSKQGSVSSDEEAKNLENDPDLKSTGSQELAASPEGAKSEALDEKSLSPKVLQEDKDSVVQEKGDTEEHGQEDSQGERESKGVEKPDNGGTNLNGQDNSPMDSNSVGTDPLGNRESFTEDDLRKWSELGDQLSSVAGKLASLIDN